jgi:hypothetical protein
MAIMSNNSGQKKFFDAGMPQGWAATHVEPLTAAGVKFKIEFTAVAAEYNGQEWKVQLPCTTTQMMNKEGPLVQTAQQKVATFVGEVAQKVAGSDTVPGASSSSGLTPAEEYIKAMKEAKELGIEADAADLVAAKPDIAKPTTAPTGKTVHLRDAKAVGQKVFGTSSGSVYTAIAIGPRVNIAARLSEGSLSVRAEFHPNNIKSSDLAALQSLGMTKGSASHYSAHMKLGGVPIGRIIGALLMDCGDLEFTAKLGSIKEFKQ